MRILLLLLISFCFSRPAFSQQDSLFEQGIALHDKGDYEAAIKIYDQIIAEHSDYHTAYFEKSLSLYSARKYQDCIDWCKLILEKFPDGKDNKSVYVNYGSCLDALNRPAEAIKIYQEGINKFPDFYLLPFNKGITEYLQKNYDDAINDLKSSVSIKPTHASSHQYLAYSIYTKNKMAAVLSLATFLLLEPTGARATKNLKVLLQLLNANVEKKDDKNINISLSPNVLNTKEKGEDDFHLVELMINMRTALDYDDKNKDLPPAQKLQKKLETFVSMKNEEKTGQKGFFNQFYIPFLWEMKKTDLLETACHIMYSSSDDTGNKKWLEENKSRVEEFNTWLVDYKWNKNQ